MVTGGPGKRFCGECGAPNDAAAAFCEACGQALEPLAGLRESEPVERTEQDVFESPFGAAWWGPSEAESPLVVEDSTSSVLEPASVRSSRTRPAGRVPRWAGRICLAGALAGAGVVGGWALGAERAGTVGAGAATSTAVRGAPPAALDEVPMPDVRGLVANEAVQLLADSGMPASGVTSTDQPAAGESGLVIAQDPVFGYAMGDEVRLVVSAPAVVPDFAGRSAEDVLDDLDALGAEVTRTSQYVPGVPPGQVARISPAPGTELPVAVEVTVSAEPDELALRDVDTQQGSCGEGEDTLGGTSFPSLLTCYASGRAGKEVYILRRAATRLSGVLGMPDAEAKASSSVALDIVGDGVVLSTVSAVYGRPTRFDVAIPGVLRLELRYRIDGDSYTSIGIGRARLLGDGDLLKQLDAS